MEETLGKRIAACRKGLGITQDRLAEQLGITAQAVSKWENDQSCPDITMLPRLAAVFGITTDQLLGISPKEESPVMQAEVVDAREEQEKEGIHIQKGGWDFHWESGRRGRVSFAVWVLLVGGLMLAAALMDWDVDMWEILWPSGLLVFGFAGLFRRFSVHSLGCGLLGAYYLASNLDLFPFSLGKDLLLPLFILVFGLGLLARAFRAPKHDQFRFCRRGKRGEAQQVCTLEDEAFRCAVSFGEERYPIDLPRLRGGTAEVSFGELTVDLTGCEEFAPGCTVEASSNFGELTILVPRRCRVLVDKSASFGSVDVSGHPAQDADQELRISAEASFGALTIRYI